MHVRFRGKKNYKSTPGVPSNGAEIVDRKKKTLSRGFNSRKECFLWGCIITEKKKKTKK